MYLGSARTSQSVAGTFSTLLIHEVKHTSVGSISWQHDLHSSLSILTTSKISSSIMSVYYGETIHAISFTVLPLNLQFQDLENRYKSGLPSVHIEVDDLKTLGFRHPLPSDLATLTSTVLERLFVVADKWLVARLDPEKCYAIQINATQKDRWYPPSVFNSTPKKYGRAWVPHCSNRPFIDFVRRN